MKANADEQKINTKKCDDNGNQRYYVHQIAYIEHWRFGGIKKVVPARNNLSLSLLRLGH